MIMPRQRLEDAVFGRVPLIRSTILTLPIQDSQLQPASLDVRLGKKAVCVRSTGLPHRRTVAELAESKKKYEFDLKLDEPNLLEVGHTYLIPLLETCSLPPEYQIEFSPKSSIGRCDVFVRVVCDHFSHYDLTPRGYHGPLWVEVTPLSFDVLVCAGLSLTQGRIRTSAEGRLTTEELYNLHNKEALLFNFGGEELPPKSLEIENGELYFHVNLNREVVGFVAKDTVIIPLDLTVREKLHPRDFWQPIAGPLEKLTLVPNKFYLLSTSEMVRIPKTVCGQVLSHKATSGEVRPHYAGFFDNGFGGSDGAHGVLEVRGRDVRFDLEDGQPVCAMAFERTLEVPNVLYEGNYSRKPSFSKHFSSREDGWEAPYWSAVR